MSVLNDGAAFLKALLGLKVARAAATLPQTAQAAIFTVGTGRVIVTSLVGTVTTATGATATNLSVIGNPTSGTDVVLASIVASASKEVGSTFTLPVAFGSALQVQNAGGAGTPLGTGFVLNPGTLDILTSASNTGSIKWDVTYVPLDDGATITAA
jgi:hypothetical protein